MSEQERRESLILAALFSAVAFLSYLVGRRDRRVYASH